MDGVIVNFVEGVIDLYRVTHDRDEVSISDIHDYNIHRYFGEHDAAFWEKIAKAELFWERLNPTPFLDDVLALVDPFDTCILSSPCKDGKCLQGKYNWIQKHMPAKYHRKFLIGPAKEFCAASNNLLIDDHEDNCEKFVAAGGRAILFPAPWNNNRKFKPVEYLKNALDKLAPARV